MRGPPTCPPPCTGSSSPRLASSVNLGTSFSGNWCGPYTLLPRVMMQGSLYDVMYAFTIISARARMHARVRPMHAGRPPTCASHQQPTMHAELCCWTHASITAVHALVQHRDVHTAQPKSTEMTVQNLPSNMLHAACSVLEEASYGMHRPGALRTSMGLQSKTGSGAQAAGAASPAPALAAE